MTSSSSEPKSRLGEFALIKKLFAPLSKGARGAFDLSDDAAALHLAEDRELVVTVDTVIEGVHFLKDDPADLIARKALRVNLSDLAAKGAAPHGYLLALSVSPWVGDAWLERFAAGLSDDQGRFDVHLLGGDTTAGPGPLTISITALGSVPRHRMIRRAGAVPGDVVYVSGTIGDAGAGLEILRGAGASLSDAQKTQLIARYRLPEPRVSLGAKLQGFASASIDVSDGLIADLAHIAEVSGVAIEIDAARIPLSAAYRALGRREIDGIVRAATSGDDYEIAFTAPLSAHAAVEAAAEEVGLAIARIGDVKAGQGVVLLHNGEPVPVERAGYTHF
jgi:thiamine-monophosphate kinase